MAEAASVTGNGKGKGTGTGKGKSTGTGTGTDTNTDKRPSNVRVRDLGVSEYTSTFAAMREFTNQRAADTLDEIWLTEHQPVFTQGQAGKAEHVLAAGDIPVVQTDRGGQVTYHGPGQITAYLLFDLRRMELSVRGLVRGIENSMINTISQYGIQGARRADAPGVYVQGDKIGSLGLRVRRGCSYHGLSLNVAMDLAPFLCINPCGLTGIKVTHMASFAEVDIAVVKQQLTAALRREYHLPG